MSLATLKLLIEGMRQIGAFEQLKSMDAISYPHMDNKERKKSHKKWSKEAFPENFEAKILKTTDLELI